MAENSNSTMEMGTSDQVLVATKRKKTLTYTVGFIAMVAVVGVVIALVVVLSGNEGGDAESIISTTQGPTTAITPETTAAPPTAAPTTPAPTEEPEPPTTLPPPEPEEEEIDLESIINGVFATPTFNATWTSGNEIIFRNSFGDLVLYDVDGGTPTILVSNSSEILQQSGRSPLLSRDGSQVALAYNIAPVYRYSFLARYASVDVVTGEVTEIVPPSLETRNTEAFLQNFVWGPSGTSLAYVYLNNIYYQANLTTPAQQITDDGVLNVIYNGIPDWVYEEEVFSSNNALWFSGDGARLAYVRFDDTQVRVMQVPHYGVPGSLNYQYTAHHDIRYPKSGTTNPTVTVVLRDLESGNNNVYSAPTTLAEPILKTVSFVNNDAIALMWTNRVQTSLVVVLCTIGQATCSQIFEYSETDGWIDNIPLIFNEAGNAFITILPQAVDGVLYKQIVEVSDVNANAWTARGRTNTAHTVLEIMQWQDGVIWYKATHTNDSAEQHIYSVNAADTVNCFTCNLRREDGEECLYNDAVISTDGSRLTLNCAGPGVPQVFIYDLNGNLVRTWDDNAETTSLVANRALPVILRTQIPVAEGYPDADVHIQVPHNYTSLNNVPMLVYVYGGPDTALVTKQWSIDWGTSLVNRWGIAVAHIDGRGSGLRGVNNMFALNRRLGTVEIEDQISVTRGLHERFPWLDSNRTCIWGWSYGGYAASLALARGGDVFRCAAAVAPVVDWRFYDTIYTERYMDVPTTNAQGYLESSLLTEQVVEAFRRKRYFLIHGTADDNVHYQHAMLLSRLLQRRDVYFTQMSYTDEDHGLVGVRPHLYHALEKFLQEHML